MNKTTATLKHQLRQTCKQIRSEIEESERHTASAIICENIENWDHFQAAEIILTYLPIKREVDLTALLRGYPEKVWAEGKPLERQNPPASREKAR